MKIFFIAVIGGVVLFGVGIFFGKELSREPANTLPALSQNIQEVQSPSEDIIVKPDSIQNDWNRWESKKEGFSLAIPPGFRMHQDGSILSEKSIAEQGVAGFTSVHIFEGSLNDYVQQANASEQKDIVVNGVQGKRLITPSPYSSQCPEYAFFHKEKVYVFFLYECMEWKDFDAVMQTFRQL